MENKTYDFKANLNLKYPLFLNWVSIPFSNKDFGLEIWKNWVNEIEIKQEIEDLNNRIMEYFIKDLTNKSKNINWINYICGENSQKILDKIEEKSVEFMEIDWKKVTLENLKYLFQDFDMKCDDVKELEKKVETSKKIMREFITQFGDEAKEILKKYKD